jgi:Fe2+ transport system protein FeoA
MTTRALRSLAGRAAALLTGRRFVQRPSLVPAGSAGAAHCAAPCAAPCPEPCSLFALPAGARARVVCVGCPFADAQRLRALGVYEGASVGVIAHRGGLLLDVRGSRLALDVAVATAITALPLAAS